MVCATEDVIQAGKETIVIELVPVECLAIGATNRAGNVLVQSNVTISTGHV